MTRSDSEDYENGGTNLRTATTQRKWSIRTTRKYGDYIRAACTGSAYRSPVHTASTYGCTFRHPYVRVSKMHPYRRPIYG